MEVLVDPNAAGATFEFYGLVCHWRRPAHSLCLDSPFPPIAHHTFRVRSDKAYKFKEIVSYVHRTIRKPDRSIYVPSMLMK